MAAATQVLPLHDKRKVVSQIPLFVCSLWGEILRFRAGRIPLSS